MEAKPCEATELHTVLTKALSEPHEDASPEWNIYRFFWWQHMGTHMAREFSNEAATPERGRMDGNQPADLDPINLGASAGPAASSCATMQSIAFTPWLSTRLCTSWQVVGKQNAGWSAWIVRRVHRLHQLDMCKHNTCWKLQVQIVKMSLLQGSWTCYEKNKDFDSRCHVAVSPTLGPPKEVGMPWISTTHTVDAFEEKKTTWLRHLQVSVAQKCFSTQQDTKTFSFLPSQAVWTWHFKLCPGIFMGIPRAKLWQFCFWPKTSGAQNVEDAGLTQDSLFHKLATEIVTNENWNT